MRNLESYDVVHVMGYRDSIGLATGLISHTRGVPLVFEPLGMFSSGGRSAILKRAFDVLLGRRLARWAAVVIATSSRERTELIRGGIDAQKIRVRPNGIDGEAFSSLPVRGVLRAELGIGEDDLVALYLGRISRRKGLPMAIEALKDIPATHLVIAGPDNRDGESELLRRMSQHADLGGRVHFVGLLDEVGKRKAFADADAVVLPSEGESFGNAALEGLAGGLPVLVTDRCGVAEFIGEAALVVPYSAGAVRDGLMTVLADANVRARLNDKRPLVLEKLGWRGVSRMQVEIYEGIVRRAARQ